jgi:HEAT repeat protein
MHEKRRPTCEMRYALWGLLLLAAACETQKTGETTLPDTEAIKDAPELSGDEATQLVRRTERNVKHYEELRLQGQTGSMVAVRRTIARTVDENFPAFREVALDTSTSVQRNMAIQALGFANEYRADARDLLVGTLGDEDPWILANAALALSRLKDPETDLSRLITLVGHADKEVRTSAATALMEIYNVRQTPRKLTPQHYAAIDRLVSLLHDKATTRGRRAAVFALANLQHPETLDHLASALEDSDEMVQIGGLYGIERLGDQRALEPVLEFLAKTPSAEAASWAKKALVRIAVQGGFTNTPSELDKLGTSAKLWRRWFRAARND